MSYERAPYWFWPIDRWNLLIALLLLFLLAIVGPRSCQAPAVGTVPSFTAPSPNAVLAPDAPGEVSGVADPGAVVRIFEGDELLTITAADENGEWTILLPELPPGQHTLIARTYDETGELLASSAPLTFTISSEPPAAVRAPTIDPLDPALSRGEAGEVSGEAEPGATVQVFDGDALLGETVAGEDGRWSVTLPALAPGPHSLVARAYDAAGNLLAESTALAFAVGEGQVAGGEGESLVFIPIITIPGGGETLVAGEPGAIGGEAEPGATVRIYEGDVLLGETTADAGGRWSFDLSPLPPGEHTLIARTYDESGEQVAESEPMTVNVAPIAVAVSPPQIAEPAPEAELPPRAPLVISGEAEPGALVRIYDGDTLLGEVTAGEDGRWAFEVPPLPAGEHSLIARVVDENETPVASSEPVAVTVPEVVETPQIEPTQEDTSLPLLTGVAPPGAVVRIYDGEVLIGETVADAFGRWSFQPVQPLAPGEHQLTPVIVVDDEETTRGEAVTATVPIAPAAGEGSPPVVVLPAVPSLPANTLPVLRGVAAPGATVRIYDGDVLLGETTADEKGNWYFVPATPLAPGEHEIRVVQVGEEGEEVAAEPVPLEISPDAQPLIPPTIVLPAKGQLAPRSVLRGTAPPNSTVQVYVNNRLLGTVVAGREGHWALRLPRDLPKGPLLLQAVVVDDEGNMLTLSAPVLANAGAPPGTLPVTGS